MLIWSEGALFCSTSNSDQSIYGTFNTVSLVWINSVLHGTEVFGIMIIPLMGTDVIAAVKCSVDYNNILTEKSQTSKIGKTQSFNGLRQNNMI